MKLREVTLKLSPTETKSLINQFVNHIIEDDKLHSMIVERVQKVAKAAAITEEVDIDLTNSAKMKRELVRGLKDMKSEMKDVTYPEGFTSKLLIDSDEQIIDRNVQTAIAVDGGDQVNALITAKNIPDGDKEFHELKVELSPKEQEDKAVFHYTNDIADSSSKRSEDMEARFYFESSGEKTHDFTFNMTSDFKGEAGSKQDIDRDFKLKLTGDEFSDVPGEIKGTIKQTSDVNLKKDYSNQKFKIEIGMEDESDSGSITFNVDSKTKLTDKADIPNLDRKSGDGINVVNMSEDEMYQIQEEVGMNLMAIAEKLGISPEDFYPQDDYYDEGYSDMDYSEDDYSDDYYDDSSDDEYYDDSSDGDI
jgi:hypothetical protein